MLSSCNKDRTQPLCKHNGGTSTVGPPLKTCTSHPKPVIMEGVARAGRAVLSARGSVIDGRGRGAGDRRERVRVGVAGVTRTAGNGG